MFAVICLPDFALQAVLRREPESRSSSIALIDSTPTNIAQSLILECTEAAKAAGVCAGLTAPQAMGRCRELVLKPRAPAAEQEAANILLQTAYALSPNLESTAPGVCTIDLRGLSFAQTGSDKAGSAQDTAPCQSSAPQQSFDFFQTAGCSSPWREGRGEREQALLLEWARKIVSTLRALNLTAQIGLAATPNLALIAARTAESGRASNLANLASHAPVTLIENPAAFFDALPIEALEPSPHVFGILKRWGIHTAGAFLALGKDAMAQRLGAEALPLFERASIDTIRPLNIIVPPDTFEEQMDFEVMIETMEPLLFVLRRFIEQLAMRIALSYRVIAELHLHLSLESGAPYERTFKVPAPTANVETLFRMLHTHLENLRTDASIVSLRLSATPIRAESQQFGLFESALRDPNHFHETLARLTALFGPERVGTPVAEATHRPDEFRMKTPEFGNTPLPRPSARAKADAAGLCLRRFRSAVHADVEFKQGRPAFISTLVISGAIKRARGPWCASGTWWDQRRWSRQEWDVETIDGQVFRLYRKDENWFVEGVYD